MQGLGNWDGRTDLLFEVKKENDASQHDHGPQETENDSGYPIARMQIELPYPGSWIRNAWWLIRVDEHLGIGYQAFEVREVLLLVSCGTDKEVFDIIVRPPKAKVGVGRKKRHVRRRRQLAHLLSSSLAFGIKNRKLVRRASVAHSRGLQLHAFVSLHQAQRLP